MSGTPRPEAPDPEGSALEPQDVVAIEAAVVALLTALGADPTSMMLEDTPRRVAAAYKEFLTPTAFEVTIFSNESAYDDLVLVSDIQFQSLCMHHLLPFFGVAHVGYIPGESIIGLSKIARAVDFFARRLQVQERMTVQIAEWLVETIKPNGVGVALVGQHTCMTLRGAEEPLAQVLTSCFRGDLAQSSLRSEFLARAGVINR